MTGPELTLQLRELLGDLVGVYRDPDLGTTRPAISHGPLPDSVTVEGLEAHVGSVPSIESEPGYRHELTLSRSWLVYLVEHDGTPAGRLQSATERVVTAFRTSSPTPIAANERLGIRNQVLVTVTP
jgi:hypothetical protein